MKKFPYSIRNYKADDFNQLVLLYVQLSRDSGRNITPEEIAEILKRPGFDPEKDLFLAFKGNEIIGYAHITPEILIGRLFLNGWIDPSYRKKRLGSHLLDLVTERACEQGIRIISANVPQENRSARVILPKLGFRYVRRYLDMVVETDNISVDRIEKTCPDCHRLLPGEEAKVMNLQNRIFREHWRYSSYDLATFMYDISLNNRSPQDIIVYTDHDEPVGYCWTELFELSVVSGVENRGIINMLGVDPEYRRQGIGRKTLQAGLAYLKSRGVRSVSLQVDSENKVARDLYGSVGFREFGSTLWYEKEVSQETQTG
ncbi:MAG: GNAT family N-acetyltransferase [Dehalococcoidales bacterium]|nr:GNAT family N-acetyltransferase [Dehalococcoidales bacterium]